MLNRSFILPCHQAEHSLELHTPYIASVMRGRAFTLVPIMVGALSTERWDCDILPAESKLSSISAPRPTPSEAHYGRLLAPYLDDPGNLFIISSDFCHWGSRFNYTFYDEAHVRSASLVEGRFGISSRLVNPQGPIWKSVQWLDDLAIKAIETVRKSSAKLK